MREIKVLNNFDIDLNVKSFITYLPEKIPLKKYQNKIENCFIQVKESSVPNFFYIIIKVLTIEKKCITINHSAKLNLNNIVSSFKNADYVVLYLCTLGKKIDDKLNQISSNNKLFEIWLFDAVSSYYIEQILENAKQRISEMNIGYKTTLTFSPGYCNWNIKDQSIIFSQFNNFIDNNEICINSSCMLTPKKSIAGIFGFVPNNNEIVIPCNVCNKTKCDWKRG